MAKSCSHWWHAPIYFILSAALAVIAITSFPSPSPHSTSLDATIFSSTNSTLPIFHNASSTLKSHGFTIIAALLELSPELFFSPSSSSLSTTVFALPDSVISNSSLPQWARILLLQYHTVPSLNLNFQSLLRISSNTCLASGVPSKNIALTKIVPQKRLIEINHSPISHPDLFLAGNISIHGILAPFTTLHPQQTTDFIPSPICSSSNSSSSPSSKSLNWKRIIRALSRNDFISFAVGLNSVLDSILRDYPGMDSGTIFAPKELHLVDSPEPLLDRVVRYHVSPEKYEFSELASLPAKTRLRTLVRGIDLQITSTFTATTPRVTIGGADVTTPDVFSTGGFIVHAISRALDLDHNSSTQ